MAVLLQPYGAPRAFRAVVPRVSIIPAAPQTCRNRGLPFCDPSAMQVLTDCSFTALKTSDGGVSAG